MASTNWIKGMVLAAGTLISSASFAGVITDTVNLNNQYVTQGQSISWTHNLNDNGFVLGSALDGFLYIDLKDDASDPFYNPTETAQVVVELSANFWDLLTGGNDDGSTTSLGGWFQFDTNLAFSSLARLNEDGFLDIALKSTQGDFLAVSSTLEILTKDAPAAVPEPSSIALLAAGLMGIVMMRRSAARKA